MSSDSTQPDKAHQGDSFISQVRPVIRQLCRYIVPRARLFPASELKNVPHSAPFDSPAARITGALKRYTEQITIPEELLAAAHAAQDHSHPEGERRIVQELIDQELRQYEGAAAEHGEHVGPNPAWRLATHALVLERLGYTRRSGGSTAESPRVTGSSDKVFHQ